MVAFLGSWLLRALFQDADGVDVLHLHRVDGEFQSIGGRDADPCPAVEASSLELLHIFQTAEERNRAALLLQCDGLYEQRSDGSVLRGLRLIAGDFCRANLLDGAVRLRDDERLGRLTVLEENAVPAIRQALPLVIIANWGAEEMLAIGTPGLDVLPREHFLTELLALPPSFFLGGVFRRSLGLTFGRYGLAPLLENGSFLVAEPEVQPEFGCHRNLGVEHLLGGVATDEQDAIAELGGRRVSETAES